VAGGALADLVEGQRGGRHDHVVDVLPLPQQGLVRGGSDDIDTQISHGSSEQG
jgi:hypothetical protein